MPKQIHKVMVEIMGTLMDYGVPRQDAHRIVVDFENTFDYEVAKSREAYRQNLATRANKIRMEKRKLAFKQLD